MDINILIETLGELEDVSNLRSWVCHDTRDVCKLFTINVT